MALRAVVFDYGMVLTGPQDPASHAELVRRTGLPIDRFEHAYWANRHAYDEGKLTGLAFWQKFLDDTGLDLGPAAAAELDALDARMWTTENPAMVAWQKQLRAHGLLTAILSNMGDSVLESIERAFDWIGNFHVLVWSYQLLLAKPDPAIYTHVLDKLDVAPHEALFLDDKLVNVEAARALGMQAIVFSTVDKLREDLVAAGIDKELPLPSES